MFTHTGLVDVRSNVFIQNIHHRSHGPTKTYTDDHGSSMITFGAVYKLLNLIRFWI